jgi:hypothetical protein
MQILVATTETQGVRPNDFNYLESGEPVYLGFVCDRDRRDPDGGCGCGRSFAGLDSHRAGTTAQVVERELDLDAYRSLIARGLAEEGWTSLTEPAALADLTDELVRLAGAFPVGTVLERRGGRIGAR